MIAPTVLKVAGELLEAPAGVDMLARVIASVALSRPLVVVHGGGREINAALASAGMARRQVEGLRVTDDATLGVVVAVLAGTINTRLVAAIGAAGGQAVGLTGADGLIGLAEPAPPHRSVDGRIVALGLVGQPVLAGPVPLLSLLQSGGFVPVVASIGADRAGRLFNVNADTFAAAIAARAGATRLVIAGTTDGVLDPCSQTIRELDPETERTQVTRGAVNAGMLAKLQACRTALSAGVPDVCIANGRQAEGLRALLMGAPARTQDDVTQVIR